MICKYWFLHLQLGGLVIQSYLKMCLRSCLQHIQALMKMLHSLQSSIHQMTQVRYFCWTPLYLIIGHEECAHSTVWLDGGCMSIVLPLRCEAALPVLPQVDEGLRPRLHFLLLLLRQARFRGLWVEIKKKKKALQPGNHLFIQLLLLSLWPRWWFMQYRVQISCLVVC